MVYNLFHFPYNFTYFLILSSNVQIRLTILINDVLQFKYQHSHLKVNQQLKKIPTQNIPLISCAAQVHMQ
jgi:hypothetical protein